MRSHVEKATACPGGLLMGLRSASQSDSLLGSELPGAEPRAHAEDWPQTGAPALSVPELRVRDKRNVPADGPGRTRRLKRARCTAMGRGVTW